MLHEVKKENNILSSFIVTARSVITYSTSIVTATVVENEIPFIGPVQRIHTFTYLTLLHNHCYT